MLPIGANAKIIMVDFDVDFTFLSGAATLSTGIHSGSFSFETTATSKRMQGVNKRIFFDLTSIRSPIKEDVSKTIQTLGLSPVLSMLVPNIGYVETSDFNSQFFQSMGVGGITNSNQFRNSASLSLFTISSARNGDGSSSFFFTDKHFKSFLNESFESFQYNNIISVLNNGERTVLAQWSGQASITNVAGFNTVPEPKLYWLIVILALLLVKKRSKTQRGVI